jgi:AraC-like DNA-binding protein
MATKSFQLQELQDVSGLLHQAKGEIPYRQVLEALSQNTPFEYATVVTSLPRGSLQIVQPPRVSDQLLKSYGKEYHAYDRPAWEAIVRGQPVRAEDCWSNGKYESSRYFTDFLGGNGLRHAVAVPLAGPVLEGYAGAIELYRTAEQGPFSDDDLRRLSELAADLDESAARARDARRHEASGDVPLRHQPPVRQFVFDQNLRPCLGEDSFNALDDRLRQNMLDLARQRFGHLNGKQSTADRVSLPDAIGDLWNFRVITHHTYPALGEGAFVFFCLQPECSDWALLRANDFAADPELSRLVPAIRFMQEHFQRGPTLQEIAKAVHLSPFHFHRRFTELLGITPKHMLLDCQIEQAKNQLVAREKELAEIATACGFAHQSHFTSRFKQATGLTPTRWRRLAVESSKQS